MPKMKLSRAAAKLQEAHRHLIEVQQAMASGHTELGISLYKAGKLHILVQGLMDVRRDVADHARTKGVRLANDEAVD